MALTFRSPKIVRICGQRYFASTSVKCDAVVIGGGIAGASSSYQLSKLQNFNVVCLEKGDPPAYNFPQGSFFSAKNARTPSMRLLSHYSKSFFKSPDPETIDTTVHDKNILEHTGLIAVSSPASYSFLYQHFGPNDGHKFDEKIKVLPQSDVRNYASFLNTNDIATYAIYERDAYNIDIGLVYKHFSIGSHKLGVNYYYNSSVVEISKHNNGNWEILSYNAGNNKIDRFESSILINAAGQWMDDIAIQADIKPINIRNTKRRIITFEFKGDIGCKQTPWIGWIDEDHHEIFHASFEGNNGVLIYDKLDNNDGIEDDGQDEMEISLHKIHKYTNLKVTNIRLAKGGIKCSVDQDANIVIGADVSDDSFIWCGALSSYGIQTAPAYGKIVSYLAAKKDLPQDIVDLGLNINDLSPARLDDLKTN